MSQTPPLPPSIEQGLAALVSAAREALGDDLLSVVLHGSAAEGRLRPSSDVNLILVLRAFEGARAAALRPALDEARIAFGASPMFVLEGELEAAVEAFAVKLADVRRRRRVLFGPDPFAAREIPRAAERERLKQVLLNQVIRMRARFLRAVRGEGPLAEALADAAGPLRAAAASLLELEGKPSPSPREALVAAVRGEPALEAAVGAMSRAREAGPLPLAEATAAYLGLMEVAERLRGRAGSGARYDRGMARRTSASTPKLAIHPLTPERWPDLVTLFGARGACAGCWCTWWRLTKAEFDAGRAEGNRRRQERYVKAGNVPGLLAYAGKEPVGWIAIEPREAFPRLARSRTLAPLDDRPVWSITCFFVARAWRGKGLTRALVDAAVRYARSRRATIVEAYPVEPGRKLADAAVYHGAASTFRAAGFVEVARRSRTRPIVRKALRRERRTL